MSVERPLISIVIPVYKVKEEFLRKCIEDCLNQTYNHLEIVLIDDGSPDQCGAICGEYAEKDDRVRVIHQENQGVSAARNAGIACASGDWLTFVDADDYLERDACQAMVDHIVRDKNLDLVIFSMVRDYEDRSIPSVGLYEQDRIFCTEKELDELRGDVLTKQLDRNVLRMTFCKAVRTEILRQNGVEFDRALPLCEDVVFWFHALQFVTKACYLDRPLYHYRQTDNSATDKYRPKVVEEHGNMLQRLQELIDDSKVPENYRHGYCLEVFYSMQRIITQGYYHPENSDRRAVRVRQCRKTFALPLYKSVLKEIDVKQLTKNHLIKYWLLRMKCYGAVAFLRTLYGGLTGRTTDKG